MGHQLMVSKEEGTALRGRTRLNGDHTAMATIFWHVGQGKKWSSICFEIIRKVYQFFMQ